MNRKDFLISCAGLIGLIKSKDKENINEHNKRFNPSFPKREKNDLDNLKGYQKYFDNVYKNIVVVLQYQFNSLPFYGTLNSTAFNYKDKNKKSYYITVAHGLSGTIKDIILYDYKNNQIPAKIEKINKYLDLAILSTPADKIKAHKIQTIDLKDMVVGEDAYIVGYPASIYRTVKKTNVAGIIELNNIQYLALDEFMVKGCSGSPAFLVRDNQLRLAGVISMISKTGNLLAIPSDYIKEVFK